jgi:hypothetical protein
MIENHGLYLTSRAFGLVVVAPFGFSLFTITRSGHLTQCLSSGANRTGLHHAFRLFNLEKTSVNPQYVRPRLAEGR